MLRRRPCLNVSRRGGAVLRSELPVAPTWASGQLLAAAASALLRALIFLLRMPTIVSTGRRRADALTRREFRRCAFTESGASSEYD